MAAGSLVDMVGIVQVDVGQALGRSRPARPSAACVGLPARPGQACCGAGGEGVEAGGEAGKGHGSLPTRCFTNILLFVKSSSFLRGAGCLRPAAACPAGSPGRSSDRLRSAARFIEAVGQGPQIHRLRTTAHGVRRAWRRMPPNARGPACASTRSTSAWLAASDVPRLAGQRLQAAGDVDRVAQDRELHPPLVADVAQHHRPEMQTDADAAARLRRWPRARRSSVPT